NRITCDEYARGIHVGRTTGGHGSPRAAVERADAPQSRVRVRARVRPAQAAEDHSAARRSLRFWSIAPSIVPSSLSSDNPSTAGCPQQDDDNGKPGRHRNESLMTTV